MTASAEQSARARPPWAAALLVLAVVLAYANTLHAPFVYDDTAAIAENPTIRHLGRLGEILGPQKEGGITVSGRPILNLSFALSYAISGPAPWGHHVLNILVHAGSALLLFGIVRRTVARHGGKSPRAAGTLDAGPASEAAAQTTWFAFAAAALWALHPLQTQAVTYTVQRAESLMGFFYLLTLYAFIRATPPPATRIGVAAAGARRESAELRAAATDVGSHGGWLGFSIAACVLGAGTKEVIATAPLVVFLYDRTFVAGSFRAAWQQRRPYYLGLMGVWLVLAALLASTGGNRGGTAGLGVGVPWWAYALTQFQAVTRYLALSLWPHPLIFEYGTFWVKTPAAVVPYLGVVVALLLATAWALRHRPTAGFLGASFFLILAPTSLTPGTIQMIVEHRMYLPLAAVVMALAIGLPRLGRGGRHVAAGLILAALVLTVDRNADYRSRAALWGDTVAKRPENPRAHEGLAEALAEAGHIQAAIAHREEAVRLLPDESHYHYNLALTLAEAGRWSDAVRHYELSLRLTPTEARTHNNLAIALVQLGRIEAAVPHYAEAVRLQPTVGQYHYNYAIALLRLGRFEDAAAQDEIALRLDPAHADAHFNRGTALVRLGRVADGIVAYRAALRLRPNEPEYLATLGSALLIHDQPDEALAAFQRAVELKPDAVDAQFGVGNALAALRRYDEAIAQYERMLRDHPDHGNARFKLGNALLDTNRLAAAVAQYEAAIKIAPDDAEAHHNLGAAYARLERWTEAGREFETALRLRPDYPDARRHLEQLRRVLGK